jgi:hypothetical protein
MKPWTDNICPLVRLEIRKENNGLVFVCYLFCRKFSYAYILLDPNLNGCKAAQNGICLIPADVFFSLLCKTVFVSHDELFRNICITHEKIWYSYDLLKYGVHLGHAHLTLPMLWAALMKAIYGMQVTAISSFTASSLAGRVLILFQRDMLSWTRYPQLPCGYELACLAEDWKDCFYRSKLSYSDLI